jgi:hypothetical protein
VCPLLKSANLTTRQINNEAIRITCHKGKDITVKFEYVGVARLSDRHQIEFFVVTLLRICRQLTGLSLSPKGIKLAHRPTDLPAGINKVFDRNVAFGRNVDEVVHPGLSKSIPAVNAIPI